jgi:hypothetical protein
MKFTKEDIERIEKFIEIKNKGYYADGGQVTEVYNRVLERSVNVTNCGSCLRGRIQELENALNHFKELSKRQDEIKAQEALKEERVDNVTPDENKVSESPKNEVVVEKRRVGRPKKS